MQLFGHGSLHPILKNFDILESVGDMDPESKGVDFLLRLLCFLSHSIVQLNPQFVRPYLK